LHAFAIAFFAQVAYAVPSFFGFPEAGTFAESRQAAAPLSDPQPWNPSSIDWQSLFFPQAAAGALQVLSMHSPQSLPPNGGAAAGGGVLALVSAGGGLEEEVSEEDAGAAEADVSSLAGFEESAVEAVSSAGVSGGLDPPQASHANGTTAQRTRVGMDSRWARVMAGLGVA
jgi:hypothetical protein